MKISTANTNKLFWDQASFIIHLFIIVAKMLFVLNNPLAKECYDCHHKHTFPVRWNKTLGPVDG